jgi:hypothetical protein
MPSALGMDQRRFSTMTDVHRLEPMSASQGRGTVLAAWERFVQGEDHGVPASTPAVDPAMRWTPGLPELIEAARYAKRQAAHNPDWVGSTQISTYLADEPTSISIRPVFLSGHLIGNLVSFRASVGAQLPQAEGSGHPRVQPGRVPVSRRNAPLVRRAPRHNLCSRKDSRV